MLPRLLLAVLFFSLGLFLVVGAVRGAPWLVREDRGSPWLTMSAPELWTRSMGRKGARWYAALMGLLLAGLGLYGILRTLSG